MVDYKKLPTRCGVENCKTRLFYLEDGHWFCKYGHRREGDVEVGAEDDFMQRGTKARTAGKEKEKKETTWDGKKGYELYMQCRQLVLRKQVKWLIEEKGLPAELELIVKDLWALRLEKLLTKVLHPALGSQSDGESQSESVYSSGYSSSQYTTQSSGGETTDGESREGSHRGGVRKKRKALSQKAHRIRSKRIYETPSLMETLGICYLGCLMLKAAISLGDFHRWVEEQNLLYYKALKVIPKNMMKKLNGRYITFLDPRTELQPGTLHRVATDLAHMYSSSFNINFPPINIAGLSIRYMLELGAPPEVYQAIKTITILLAVDYAFTKINTNRSSIRDWPECRLMAVTLLAFKLATGLGESKRIPLHPHEMGAVKLDMEKYRDFLKEAIDADQKKSYNKELELKVTEEDALGMSLEDMDKYMDWYEKHWLRDDDISRIPSQILNIFPAQGSTDPTETSNGTRTAAEAQEGTGDSQPSALSTEGSELETLLWRITNVHRSISLISPRAHLKGFSKTDRPGRGFLHYARVAEIPADIQLLIEAGAIIIGVEPKEMRAALSSIEIRAEDWGRQVRKLD